MNDIRDNLTEGLKLHFRAYLIFVFGGGVPYCRLGRPASTAMAGGGYETTLLSRCAGRLYGTSTIAVWISSDYKATCGRMGDMKRSFATTIWREGDWFVSQCLEVDVASQGETEEEALANLKEALELYFEPPQATRPPKVRMIEVEIGAA